MKIFKPNRENQSTDQRRSLWSYLGFAIAEISLLVFGILIAVTINNWNEAQKQEKELLNIFGSVKEDLQNDIEEIQVVLDQYDRIKPIFNKVIKDSLSREDYEKNRGLGFLILGYPEISLDTRGFHLLSNYKSGTNAFKDTLVSNIVDFYTERLLEIKVDDDLRNTDFTENFEYWKSNYAWWATYVHEKKITPSFIDYALTSQDYKNRVATVYFLTYDVYLPEVIAFKEQGLDLVEMIESRLKTLD